MAKTMFYKLHCKACNEVIGSFPYTNKNFCVQLFYGKFLCNDCTRKMKK